MCEFMSLEEQTAALLGFGVDEQHIWRIDEDSTEDIVGAIRPGNDMFVVPFTGGLGEDWADILEGISQKGATLFDLQENSEYQISQAPTFATLK